MGCYIYDMFEGDDLKRILDAEAELEKISQSMVEGYGWNKDEFYISEKRQQELDERFLNVKIEEILFHKEFSLGDKKYLLNKNHNFSNKEIAELIKHAFKEEQKRKLKKAKRVIRKKAQELYGENGGMEREPISDDVKEAVWQRDRGRCVKCGSNEKLEFDHIIPVSKGGSNTSRNLQLLCESCNREKSNKI